MNTLPTWAKLIGTIGFPAAIAVWLLWIVTGTLAAHGIATTQVQKIVVSHVEASDRALLLLERICRRLGKTDAEREAC